MCLEGLGQPRAGSLLPVLRGARPLGEQHEEKKVAVVLRRQGAESQLCTEEGEPRGNTRRQTASVRSGGGPPNADIRATWGRGEGGPSLQLCTAAMSPHDIPQYQ